MIRTLFLSGVVAVFALGCESGSGPTLLDDLPSICSEPGAPAGCGDPCLSDSGCDAGAFCNNAICIAVCTPEGGQCGAAAECITNGRCVPVFGDGGVSTSGGPMCGELELTTDRVIPNIMMIVDRSGSMVGDFGGNSRWESVIETLVGTNGLVRRLDPIARFGLTLYWKPEENLPSMSDGDMCASTDGVAITESLNNANSIAFGFTSNTPGGFTPTAEAFEAVTDSLLATPPPAGPTVYLLATDGEPNGCDENADILDRNNSVSAVERAFDLGVETFVLGVSFDDSHLQDLANAGRGVDSGATLWTADNVSELQTALEQIVVQNIPCTVRLTDGTIDTRAACEGEVRLNNEVLACDDVERGWRVVDGNTIELTGSACQDWRGGDGNLEALFPCFVVVQ